MAAPPTRAGLCGHTLKVNQQPDVADMPSAFAWSSTGTNHQSIVGGNFLDATGHNMTILVTLDALLIPPSTHHQSFQNSFHLTLSHIYARTVIDVDTNAVTSLRAHAFAL